MSDAERREPVLRQPYRAPSATVIGGVEQLTAGAGPEVKDSPQGAYQHRQPPRSDDPREGND
jgi:hypothetical protein